MARQDNELLCKISTDNGATWTDKFRNYIMDSVITFLNNNSNNKIQLLLRDTSDDKFKNYMVDSTKDITKLEGFAYKTADNKFHNCIMDKMIFTENKLYILGAYNNSIFSGSVYVYDLGKTGATWEYICSMKNQHFDINYGTQYQTTLFYDNKIWIIGGYSQPLLIPAQMSSAVEYLDLSTNQTVSKASLNVANIPTHLCVIDDLIYSVSGYHTTFQSCIEEYDPVADSWTKYNLNNTNSLITGSVSVSTNIYMVQENNTFCKFDTINKTFTTLAAAPTSGTLVNDDINIYLLGSNAQLYEYNISINTWIDRGSMNSLSNRYNIAKFYPQNGNEVPIIGGEQPAGTIIDSADYIDLSGNLNASYTDLTFPRECGFAFHHTDPSGTKYLYVLGGSSTIGVGNPINTFQRLNITTGTWEDLPSYPVTIVGGNYYLYNSNL